MSSLRNNVKLIGHLGIDPEYKRLESGREVIRFRLATTVNYRDKNNEWQSNTQWHNIVCWGALSQRIQNNLHKGSYIALEGSLQYRNYQDNTGHTKYVTEILMDSYISFDKNNIQMDNNTLQTSNNDHAISNLNDEDLPF